MKLPPLSKFTWAFFSVIGFWTCFYLLTKSDDTEISMTLLFIGAFVYFALVFSNVWDITDWTTSFAVFALVSGTAAAGNFVYTMQLVIPLYTHITTYMLVSLLIGCMFIAPTFYFLASVPTQAKILWAYLTENYHRAVPIQHHIYDEVWVLKKGEFYFVAAPHGVMYVSIPSQATSFMSAYKALLAAKKHGLWYVDN